MSIIIIIIISLINSCLTWQGHTTSCF